MASPHRAAGDSLNDEWFDEDDDYEGERHEFKRHRTGSGTHGGDQMNDQDDQDDQDDQEGDDSDDNDQGESGYGGVGEGGGGAAGGGAAGGRSDGDGDGDGGAVGRGEGGDGGVLLDAFTEEAVIAHHQATGVAITPGDIEQLLGALEARWALPPNATSAGVRLMAYTRLGVDEISRVGSVVDLSKLRDAYDAHVATALRVYATGHDLGTIGDVSDDAIKNRERAVRIFETMHHAYAVVRGEWLAMKALDTHDNTNLPLDVQVFQFSFKEYDKNTAYQNLLLYLLRCLRERNYKRYGESVYEQQYTSDGYATHAWVEVCDIKTFVFRACDKDTHSVQWQNLTASGMNRSQAVEYLANCHDIEFSELVPDHKTFAFRDGIYRLNPDSTTDRDQFIRYGTDAARALSVRCVAVKYFDVPFVRDDGEFDDGAEHSDISTPLFDSIFEYQGMTPETLEWCYILVGRLLYDVNEKDRWEAIVLIKGPAGCGKSTIANIIKHLYPANLVGCISSNCEVKFGLSAFHDKRIAICSELKDSFAIPIGDIQSMASGEEIAVAIKNKTAICVKWKVPVIMMGNELPSSWIDCAGSITRRMVCISMARRVLPQNLCLLDQITSTELGALLLKCNRAYLRAASHHYRTDLWSPDSVTGEVALPPQLHDFRNELRRVTDGLQCYLESGEDVTMKPEEGDAYMPLQEFRDLYVRYRRDNGLPPIKWGPDQYQTTFQANKLRVERQDQPREWRGKMYTSDLLFGVEMAGRAEDV